MIMIYFLHMAYLRQSERSDLSFHVVKQFFSEFTKNGKQWTLKSKKRLELELNGKKVVTVRWALVKSKWPW